MKTALVLGGTRFFGVDLVQALLARGVEVTVATRQQTPVPFLGRVELLKLDRYDQASFTEAVNGRKWDVVFDQICYNAQDARLAIAVLQSKISKYIFTSTMSVYPFQGNLMESQFNPNTCSIVGKEALTGTYQEGKQQAEAVFFQEAPFPVVAVRIPIVMGEQDYTKRLLFHIDRVKAEQPIGFPNIQAEMGFIHQREAGEFLAWVSEQPFVGPINACANGVWSLRKLMDMIETEVGKKAILPQSFTKEEHSPYGIETSWYISNQKAIELGFCFSDLDMWLPALIRKLTQNNL